MQESKQNASVFEGLPTMKSRHVELSIAADGNFIHTDNILFSISDYSCNSLHLGSPRLRYSHEASGPIRGYLPLKDAICSDVSQHGQHAAVFCVPSVIFKVSSCSVDQETTAKGDSGFQFKDDCNHVTFPFGMFSVCFVSKLPQTLSRLNFHQVQQPCSQITLWVTPMHRICIAGLHIGLLKCVETGAHDTLLAMPFHLHYVLQGLGMRTCSSRTDDC